MVVRAYKNRIHQTPTPKGQWVRGVGGWSEFQIIMILPTRTATFRSEAKLC